MKPRSPRGKSHIILLLTLIIVVGVSLLPLNRLSGGLLRDFSLFDDIVKEEFRVTNVDPVADEAAPVDSALTAMQLELEAADKIAPSRPDTATVIPVPEAIDPHRADYIAIEDYSDGGTALAALRQSFAAASRRTVRVAFVGDSYIEADIFTQDVRSRLQSQYGGSGVGYVNMYSEFPGFRRSVRQSGDGWLVSVAGKKGYKNTYAWLSEQYATPKGSSSATARYVGTNKVPHAASWSRSTIAYWAPSGGTLKTRLNASGEWAITTADPADALRTLTIPADSAATREFAVTLSPGITALGVWLDAATGVAVDCMSSRGFSGVTLRDVNPEVCRSLTAAGLGYDLIVLEFGINAMQAGKTDYSAYSRLMVKVIDHVRECYPSAQILFMGVGDRGEKRGSEIKSMPAAPAMVAAQRDAARKARILFWDTREAMGGDNAIVAWANANPPRANKDYIHLNHHGGAVLAEEFVKSLSHAIAP